MIITEWYLYILVCSANTDLLLSVKDLFTSTHLHQIVYKLKTSTRIKFKEKVKS